MAKQIKVRGISKLPSSMQRAVKGFVSDYKVLRIDFEKVEDDESPRNYIAMRVIAWGQREDGTHQIRDIFEWGSSFIDLARAEDFLRVATGFSTPILYGVKFERNGG